MTEYTYDTGNWYIRRVADSLWFSGFNPDGTERWGSASASKPYPTKQEAECQALFLKPDNEVQHDASRVHK